MSFNPKQPRDPDGQWSDGIYGVVQKVAGVLFQADDYDSYPYQRFFRIQNANRDWNDLLDQTNWESRNYGAEIYITDPETGEEVEDVRHGISAMESLDELAEYLANSGIEFDPNSSVIVEMGGEYADDDDHDADQGAVLVEPDKILKVQEVPDDFFELIEHYLAA